MKTLFLIFSLSAFQPFSFCAHGAIGGAVSPGAGGGGGSGISQATADGMTNLLAQYSTARFRWLDFTSHTNTTPGADVGSPLGGTYQFIGNEWTNARVTNGFLWLDYRAGVSNSATAASFYMVTTSSIPVVAMMVYYQITNVNPAASANGATIQLGFQVASNSPDAGGKVYSSGNMAHNSYAGNGTFTHQFASNGNFHTLGTIGSYFRADSSWKRLLIVYPGGGRQRIYGDGFAQSTNAQVTAPVVDMVRPQGTNGPTYLTLQVYNADSSTNVYYNFLIRGIGYANAEGAAEWITQMAVNPPGTVATVTNTANTNGVYDIGLNYDDVGLRGVRGWWNNSSNLFSVDYRGWWNVVVDPGINTPLVPSAPFQINGSVSGSGTEDAQLLITRTTGPVGLALGSAGVPEWYLNMYGGGTLLRIRAASGINSDRATFDQGGAVTLSVAGSSTTVNGSAVVNENITLLGSNIFLGTRSVLSNNIAVTNTFLCPVTRSGGITIGPGGNVGIGTNAPGRTLDVSGTIVAGNGTVSQPSYSFNGSTNAGFYQPSAAAVALTVGGVASWANFGSTHRQASTMQFGWASGDAVSQNFDIMQYRAGAGTNGFSAGTTSVPTGSLLASNAVLRGGLQIGPGGTGGFLTNTLFASATLDFASQTVGAFEDLPITVAGAADGDIVTVGKPVGSMTGIVGSYSGFASNGVVYVRFVSTGSAQNPASGTFKVRVDKFQ